MDLKWMFYKCCEISLAWHWHRGLTLTVCQTSLVNLSAFSLRLVSPVCCHCSPIYLCVWLCGLHVKLCVYVECISMRLCVWQAVVLSRSSAMTLSVWPRFTWSGTCSCCAQVLNLASFCSLPIIMLVGRKGSFFLHMKQMQNHCVILGIPSTFHYQNLTKWSVNQWINPSNLSLNYFNIK